LDGFWGRIGVGVGGRIEVSVGVGLGEGGGVGGYKQKEGLCFGALSGL
jgi:hypothetical protein